MTIKIQDCHWQKQCNGGLSLQPSYQELCAKGGDRQGAGEWDGDVTKDRGQYESGRFRWELRKYYGSLMCYLIMGNEDKEME